MEELNTTEALDREILEDARKKALKILKSADDSIGLSKTSWDKKLEKSREKARQSFTEKKEQLNKEIMNRFPMDKRRIRSETIETFLNNAMKDFLVSLDRPAVLRVLKNELEKRRQEIPPDLEREALIRFRMLSKDECASLVNSFFSGVSFTYSEDPLRMLSGSFPALVIDFTQLRITVSLDKAAETLLLDKRAELATALLGDIEDG